MLFEAVRFALMVAEERGGAFDPTVGHRMEGRGFNREYHTGQIIHTPMTPDYGASYRDVELDAERQTITLRRAADARSGRGGERTGRGYGGARTGAVS